MGKHIKPYISSVKLNEIVHGDLSDLTLKIYLPANTIDIEKFEVNLNNLLRLTTHFYKTKIYKNLIISRVKIDANFFKFTTDYATRLFTELRPNLEKFDTEIKDSKIEDSEIIIYLK